VRADNLARLTPAGQQALIDYGVRTIIDLRNPRELSISANPFAAGQANDGPVYRHLPFEDATDSATRAEIDAATTVAAIYRLMLGRNQRRVGAVMQAIAGAPAGGVLVHCHAGKDRTGLIVALLLHLVETPHQTIVEDYALSSVYWQSEHDAWLATIANPRQRDEERQRWGQPEATMRQVLEELDTDHGGAESYLRAAGVTDAAIERIRARLVGS
jgi:protein-tyrosine phosphatase